MAQNDSNRLTVIIVGLGIAGLSVAIECHSKGHNVMVFEKYEELKQMEGDGISIGSNGARVTAKWGDGAFHELIRPLEFQTNRAKVFDYTGYCYGTFELHGYNEGRGYTVNRGALVSAMHQYAQSLGIPIALGSEVTKYWETKDEAGIEVDGRRISADCVICAEGIHSQGRLSITGQQMNLQETGYAASRGYLDAQVAACSPSLSWILSEEESGSEDCIYGWLGPGVHFGITTKKKDNELFWYCSHKRRMIVVGDAAHAALPSSGQGGTQAIEDAATLAIALDLAGKKDVPLALSVTEKIRYRRAQIVQQGGLAVLQFVMNHVDFDALRQDPTMVKPPHPAWILDHDCQEYALKEFSKVAEAVRNGQEYVPCNIPGDGRYRMEYDSK
ncbi:FAD-dependent oxidoreductase [Aspergillus brunneoviolaceus CBS 621.78]|uniref:FAD/NAD(P)-binding domain-containing protein n=1 Tax=Aspergillus brunneoviolaceus CBS 621.78 TaxID=1450534 RepID=A0ACD1GBI2_9EURO|nr:FAD/NAD(P)-binding domain-containing protein [Aspergillus brunneoviolaceus CBS 621.78]RAH46611.1 FAD/NAD(P)-binding domain-containing protein [Aspergillus brunneoviolaceus CBS 621.78]